MLRQSSRNIRLSYDAKRCGCAAELRVKSVSRLKHLLQFMGGKELRYRPYIARGIAILVVLTILILVPTARALTAWLKAFVTSSEGTYNTVVLIISLLFSAGALFYFYQTKRRYTFLQWLVHAFLLCLPLGIGRLLMTHPSELAHIPLYGTLTVALIFSFTDPSKPYTVPKTFALALGMGLIDEGLQWIHPDRFCDFHDVALNTTAITLGLLIAEPLRKGIQKN